MLQSVVRNGTGYAAALPDRPVAGKTGTAEGARDLWFIGSIPQLTTAVWLGYDENFKTGSSSAQAAATWSSFMAEVTKGMPVQKFPPKPTLTGSFIPYVPLKHKPKRAQGQAVRQENTEVSPLPEAGENRWQPPPERTGSLTKPPAPEPSSWQPPVSPSPSRATEPALAPRPIEQTPAAASPPPAPAVAPPPAAAPVNPPPPLTAPPPVP